MRNECFYDFKLPLGIPSSEDGENKNFLPNDETDSATNVNDRDQVGKLINF